MCVCPVPVPVPVCVPAPVPSPAPKRRQATVCAFSAFSTCTHTYTQKVDKPTPLVDQFRHTSVACTTLSLVLPAVSLLVSLARQYHQLSQPCQQQPKTSLLSNEFVEKQKIAPENGWWRTQRKPLQRRTGSNSTLHTTSRCTRHTLTHLHTAHSRTQTLTHTSSGAHALFCLQFLASPLVTGINGSWALRSVPMFVRCRLIATNHSALIELLSYGSL